jgi:VWFA-related protein
MHRLMKRSRIIVCVLLGVVTVAFAQENASVGGSSTVKVLFLARDRSGKLVQDLKPGDLTVIDNGRPAKVLGLEPAEKFPLRIGMLLLAEQTTFKAQQEAAIQLLGTLRPGTDQAFVLTQATSPKPRPWPNQNLTWDPDPKALISFVGRLKWNEAVTSTKDVIMQMLALNPNKSFRRVMVEFRDPEMETTVGGSIGERLDARQMREISEYERRNAIVYTFTIKTLLHPQLSNPPKYPPDGMPGQPANPNGGDLVYGDILYEGSVKIERTAVMTGGRYLAWDKLKSEVAELHKDLQNQLLISFASQPDNRQQHPHSLEIRVNRKDVRVSSPKQFYPATAGAQ